MTWAYHNGADIDTAEKRAIIINEVAKFPVVSMVSVDTKEDGGASPAYEGFRNELREANPKCKILAHLNAVESETPDSPGQRIIKTNHGDSYPIDAFFGPPSNAINHVWYENPPGTILLHTGAFGTKAYLDMSRTEAQDLLYNAMVGQYGEDADSWPQSTTNAYWDGLYLDQFIHVFGGTPNVQGVGASEVEQEADRVGLQNVLTRFRERYEGAVVVVNTNYNYRDCAGELLEGRTADIDEAASSAGHTFPEINVYMHKPASVATDAEIQTEYNRARSVEAYFAYAPGPDFFTSTEPTEIWPEAFNTLISGDWKSWLISRGITF